MMRKIEPTIIGTIDSGAWDYISKLPFEKDNYLSTKGRKTYPINLKIIPAGPGKHRTTPARNDKRITDFLLRTGALEAKGLFALILSYQPGGLINLHRDGNGYGPRALTVSSTDYFLQLGATTYSVGANQIISFPSKTLHSA